MQICQIQNIRNTSSELHVGQGLTVKGISLSIKLTINSEYWQCLYLQFFERASSHIVWLSEWIIHRRCDAFQGWGASTASQNCWILMTRRWPGQVITRKASWLLHWLLLKHSSQDRMTSQSTPERANVYQCLCQYSPKILTQKWVVRGISSLYSLAIWRTAVDVF